MVRSLAIEASSEAVGRFLPCSVACANPSDSAATARLAAASRFKRRCISVSKRTRCSRVVAGSAIQGGLYGSRRQSGGVEEALQAPLIALWAAQISADLPRATWCRGDASEGSQPVRRREGSQTATDAGQELDAQCYADPWRRSQPSAHGLE